MNNLLFFNMRYTILCILVICTTFSSAAVIPINYVSNEIIEEPAMSEAPPFNISASTPRTETTHTVAETHRIVSTDDTESLVNEFNQILTVKQSDLSTEVINEIDKTYAKIGTDGSGELLAVSGLNDEYNTQSANGVNDLYGKDEVSTVYGMNKADSTRELFAVNGANEIEKIIDSTGLESTLLASEDHAFHAVESSDGASELKGESQKNLIYTSGNGENADEILAVDEANKLSQSNDGNGLSQSTKETNILALGEFQGVKKLLAVNDVDKKIGLHDGDADAVVNVDKTNKFQHSVDSEGNVNISEVNSVDRNVNLKDGDVDISVGIDQVHSALTFEDKDGITGAYSGDTTSRTVRINDGDVETNIGIDKIDAISGFKNLDGNKDVSKVEEVDRYFSMNNNQGGFALSVDERNQLHRVVDDYGVQEGDSLDEVNVALVVSDSTFNEDELFKVNNVQDTAVQSANDLGGLEKKNNVDETFEENDHDDPPCNDRFISHAKIEKVTESFASNAFNQLINKVDEYYAESNIVDLNRMFGALLLPKVIVQININIKEEPPLNEVSKSLFPFMPYLGNRNNKE